MNGKFKEKCEVMDGEIKGFEYIRQNLLKEKESLQGMLESVKNQFKIALENNQEKEGKI